MDNNFYIGDYLEQEYTSFNSFQSCSLDQEAFVSSLLSSMDQSEHNDNGFAYYSLHFSQNDLALLSHMQIDRFNVFVSYGELENIQDKIKSFLQSVLVENQKQTLSQPISHLLTQVVTHIMAASSHNNAVVSIVAYSHVQENYFPYWHMDKTHEEELALTHHNAFKEQSVFIITFKGPSTLYHKADLALRQEFYRQANETQHTYGYSAELFYRSQEGLDKLFSLEKAESAILSEGSVHRAGKYFGAIHASPKEEERLVMLVTPSDTSIINALQHFF